MHERSIPLPRSNGEETPQPQTGRQFADRIYEEQLSVPEGGWAQLSFDLPPRDNEYPRPVQLTFSPNQVINVADPERPGPSNRLLIVGNVSYDTGEAALAMVYFSADDHPLIDGLLVDPIAIANPPQS